MKYIPLVTSQITTNSEVATLLLAKEILFSALSNAAHIGQVCLVSTNISSLRTISDNISALQTDPLHLDRLLVTLQWTFDETMLFWHFDVSVLFLLDGHLFKRSFFGFLGNER